MATTMSQKIQLGTAAWAQGCAHMPCGQCSVHDAVLAADMRHSLLAVCCVHCRELSWTLWQAMKQDPSGDQSCPEPPAKAEPGEAPHRGPSGGHKAEALGVYIEQPLADACHAGVAGMAGIPANAVVLKNEPNEVIAALPVDTAVGDGATEVMECVICWEVDASVLFQPCGHFCTCLACANACMMKEARICPMCRTMVDSIIHLAN